VDRGIFGGKDMNQENYKTENECFHGQPELNASCPPTSKRKILLLKIFTEQFGLSGTQAYKYLDKYHGIEFFKKHYDFLQTLSDEYIAEIIADYCYSRGGKPL